MNEAIKQIDVEKWKKRLKELSEIVRQKESNKQKSQKELEDERFIKLFNEL